MSLEDLDCLVTITIAKCLSAGGAGRVLRCHRDPGTEGEEEGEEEGGARPCSSVVITIGTLGCHPPLPLACQENHLFPKVSV